MPFPEFIASSVHFKVLNPELQLKLEF